MAPETYASRWRFRFEASSSAWTTIPRLAIHGPTHVTSFEPQTNIVSAIDAK
ncbi:hypothetical protein PPTG_22416 [Phytophthora nicotianae INRA-310]|uniref:Uncharacterized protein n=1 Tax=Phytophthora nicotianae (strain INRA-310) TaxID=761204 RepID=W2QI37_PHYN3|nr:hypothetical protein PPTG_22416 [Phytophthora nicotianae INRA-310]ETN12802.1 hypothetical protein PPTG_22416 [Phytophthora nicotianae INRA-310]